MENSTAKVSRIVLTGIPGTAKTAALREIEKSFTKMGYTLFFARNADEALSAANAQRWRFENPADYALCRTLFQTAEEVTLDEAASMIRADKILIVCDGGIMDAKAALPGKDFDDMLERGGWNEVDLRDRYDAVLLMDAGPGVHQRGAALQNGLISAWTGHPHFRVIPYKDMLEKELKAVIEEIFLFLGEPEAYEIEKKYLIRYPNLKWLSALPHSRSVEILQTYLKNTPEEEIRVRRRGHDGHYIYAITTKRKVSGIKRVETERRLTEEEYEQVLKEHTPRGRISKTRWCITYKGQYLEIDIYPFWDDRAILEIELRHEDDEIEIPSQLHVIRDVTEDPAYKNSALARSGGRM